MGWWEVFVKKRNPQLATCSGKRFPKNLSHFCLAYIGRILLTLHKKKNPLLKRNGYILNLVSCHETEELPSITVQR